MPSDWIQEASFALISDRIHYQSGEEVSVQRVTLEATLQQGSLAE